MTASHIAGIDIEVAGHLRQLCAWCGAVLVDYELAHVGVAGPVWTRPATWPVGSIVRRDGAMSTVVEHTDGDPVPDDCCAHLPPDATLPGAW